MTTGRFVVTRYAHGACGRFLSTVLQTSPQIACWNETVQECKSVRDSDCFEQFHSLVTNSFADNPSWHLRHEPDVPYRTDFYSGNFERGETVSLQEYVECQQDCPVFMQHWNSKEYLNLILHKGRIPDFMQHSKIFNVILDTDNSVELAKAFSWIKRFEVVDDHSVRIIGNDPDRGNPKRAEITKRYNNPSLITVESIEQYRKQVIDEDPIWDLFSSPGKLTQHNSNADCGQVYWSLNNIFDQDTFVYSILKAFEELGVEPGSIDVIVNIYNIYWKKQRAHLDEFGYSSLQRI